MWEVEDASFNVSIIEYNTSQKGDMNIFNSQIPDTLFIAKVFDIFFDGYVAYLFYLLQTFYFSPRRIRNLM